MTDLKLKCLWCYSNNVKQVSKDEVLNLYHKEGKDLGWIFEHGESLDGSKIYFIQCLNCNLFTWCSKDPEIAGKVENENDTESIDFEGWSSEASKNVYIDIGLKPEGRIPWLPSIDKYVTFNRYFKAYKNGEVNRKN